MKRTLLTVAAVASIAITRAQEFRETIGNVTTTPTAIAAYTGFDNHNTLKFSGTADLRNTNTSTGYRDYSGTGNVYLPKTSAYFKIDSINTSSIIMPTLAFGIRKALSTDNGSELVIEYSVDGTTWTALSMPALPVGTANTWYYRVAPGLPCVPRLSIRFSKPSTNNFYFLDDIAVSTRTKAYDSIIPTTHIYKTADITRNTLDVFLPPDRTSLSTLVPVMILFHGGSWSSGDKSYMSKHCQYFAKRGIVTVSVNYRFRNLDSAGPAGTKEICVRDAKSAIRWIKMNAATFGIDTNKIILGGGSAGGHLATMAAVNDANNNDPTDNLAISTKASALFLLNPAFSRYDTYPLLPYNYINKYSPPAIMMYGTTDGWKRGGDMLFQSMNAHLDSSEMWVAPGQGHGFYSDWEWGFAANVKGDNFLTRLNLLPSYGYSFPLATTGSKQLQSQAHQPLVGAFHETMGTAESSFSVQGYRYDSGFSNAKLVLTGDAIANHLNSSTGYSNASAGMNISLGTTRSFFQVSGINSTGLVSPTLSFGIYKNVDSSKAADLKIEFATDGYTWQPLPFQLLPDSSNSTRWHYRLVRGLPQSASLSIRFTKNTGASYLLIDDVAVNDSAATAPLNIRGVKWRQYSTDEFLQTTVDWWLAKPVGSSKPGVLNAIATKANSVVFRIDRYDRFEAPQQTNYIKAMNEVVDAIVKAKTGNVPIDVYLWGRIWLERDGGPNYGSADAGAEAVKTWFTTVLDKADSAGVLDHIKGIGLIETNCDRMIDVKDYAKRIADKFNAVSAWNDANGVPFFQKRTLMIPGAGFGADFRNVNNDGGAFLEEMSKRCAHFAFTYKLMKGSEETVTGPDYDNVVINGVTRTWANDIEKNTPTFSVTDRKAYLNHFGLSELTNYVGLHRSQYPTTSNIVFWGDKWDGISQTQPLTRQALHSQLVMNGGDSVANGNYFFDLAACPTSNPSAKKFYLFDSTLNPMTVPGWTGIGIAAEWDNWATPSTQMMPFYESVGVTPGGLFATQSAGLYDNKNLLLNFGGNSTVQTAITSTGYAGSSGGASFKLSPVNSYLQINQLNTSSLSGAGVGFGIYKADTADNGHGLKVKYSTDGNNWTTLASIDLPTGAGTPGWYFRTVEGLPASRTLHLRFEVDDMGTDSCLIDDIYIGEGSLLPAPSSTIITQRITTARETSPNTQSVVYPNPVKDYFILNHPVMDKPATLIFGSLNGNIILRQTVAAGSAQTRVNLEQFHLPAGVYWLQVKNERISMIQTILKVTSN